VDQKCRIASLAVGTKGYLDVFANRANPGYYRVTSVDRQGNEGQVPQAAPGAPANLRIVR
jgi:hypothetical protein